MSEVTTRRGPNWSNSTPIGTCATNSAMKNAALARPNAGGDRSRSRISSGPSALVEARKNWLAMVTATSLVSRAVVVMP